MTATVEAHTEEETEKSPSAKRELAATVTATGVGIVLSIGANVLIGKLTKKMHDKMTDTEDTNEE